MNQNSPLLSVRDLTVTFKAMGRRLCAVQKLCFDLLPGEITALVGESGCGKSLTARAILRLPPENAHLSGSILLGDRDLLQLEESEMRTLRGRVISMIFQEPMTALNPVLTVGHQASEVLTTHLDLPQDEAKRQVLSLFRQVGIPEAENRYQSYPHQLSGGMRQRVMIAMSLLLNPKLLLADEPTTALDATIRQQILELISKQSLGRNMAVLFISHDLDVVESMADAVGVMYAGHLVEWARADTLFTHPLHPYTKGLLEAAPHRITSRRFRLKTIPGAVPSLADLPSGCPFAPRCAEKEDICQSAMPPSCEFQGHTVACWKVNREV